METYENKLLEEKLLDAWIGLNGMFKDSRMTKELTYNEAIVMKVVFDQYRLDQVGRTSMQQILEETRLLKSLLNRTVRSLEEKGLLVRERDAKDQRRVYVRPDPQKLETFLSVHEESISKIKKIMDLVGEEDARTFIRIYEKLLNAPEDLGL